MMRPFIFLWVAGIASISSAQLYNDSTFNCTSVDWSELNTTNYTELDVVFEKCLDRYSQYEDCPDPSLCEASSPGNKNLGLAFGLTAAAGLATTIGSLLPFVPCIKRSDTKFLAASLGLAAGVMIYVSFTEIFFKSQYQFCCVSLDHHNLFTTLCFFVGIFLTILLDFLVKLLEKVDCGCFNCVKWQMSCPSFSWRTQNMTVLEGSTSPTYVGSTTVTSPIRARNRNVVVDPSEPQLDNEGNNLVRSRSSCNDENNRSESPSLLHNRCELGANNHMDPDSERINAYTPNTERASISAVSNTISTTTNNLGDASIQDLLSNTSIHRLHAVIAESVSVMNEDQSHVSISLNDDGLSLRTQSIPNGEAVSRTSGPSMNRRNSDSDGDVIPNRHNEDPIVSTDSEHQLDKIVSVLGKDSKRLKRMGVLTGLAIALHNFPEGLATFIATLSDPSLGAALTLAIALHNIPEGVCVSMPIYYATGSRLKAFLWAFLSGVSEPIGALLGWIVLRNFFGPIVYGVSFGIIAGMMVYISVKELLPAAHKFDTTNGILVTVFVVTGMIIMAISLVLFYY